jgi:hypothetical protein
MTIDYDKLAFLDTETTGLDPTRHEVWEIAYILGEHEKRFVMQPDLRNADPRALEISHYYDVEAQVQEGQKDPDTAQVIWEAPQTVAWHISRDLRGRHIVGNVPSFDDAFLKAFLHRMGQPVTWRYHLIDIEPMIVGYLMGTQSMDTVRLPWGSDDLSLILGVEPPSDEERHTALGDARWVKRQYEAIMGNQP